MSQYLNALLSLRKRKSLRQKVSWRMNELSNQDAVCKNAVGIISWTGTDKPCFKQKVRHFYSQVSTNESNAIDSSSDSDCQNRLEPPLMKYTIKREHRWNYVKRSNWNWHKCQPGFESHIQLDLVCTLVTFPEGLSCALAWCIAAHALIKCFSSYSMSRPLVV